MAQSLGPHGIRGPGRPGGLELRAAGGPREASARAHRRRHLSEHRASAQHRHPFSRQVFCLMHVHMQTVRVQNNLFNIYGDI